MLTQPRAESYRIIDPRFKVSGPKKKKELAWAARAMSSWFSRHGCQFALCASSRAAGFSWGPGCGFFSPADLREKGKKKKKESMNCFLVALGDVCFSQLKCVFRLTLGAEERSLIQQSRARLSQNTFTE